MVKQFCDICNKEITNKKNSVILYWRYISRLGEYCLDCFKKESTWKKSIEKLDKKIKE